MNLNLSSEVEALIADRVRSGRYTSPEAVVTAAMHALQVGEAPGEFDPGEWDALVAGQCGDVTFDGQSVLAVLKALRREAAIK